jgi:hypothetical protein
MLVLLAVFPLVLVFFLSKLFYFFYLFFFIYRLVKITIVNLIELFLFSLDNIIFASVRVYVSREKSSSSIRSNSISGNVSN